MMGIRTFFSKLCVTLHVSVGPSLLLQSWASILERAHDGLVDLSVVRLILVFVSLDRGVETELSLLL
jgi:hypothetical protein